MVAWRKGLREKLGFTDEWLRVLCLHCFLEATVGGQSVSSAQPSSLTGTGPEQAGGMDVVPIDEALVEQNASTSYMTLER